MLRMKPTEAFLTDIRRTWEQAPSAKERKEIIEKAAQEFNYSYCNMTRKLKLRAKKRSLSAEQAERAKELETYSRVVYDFIAKAEYDSKSFSVELAYDLLLNDGQIPKEYTLSMIRRKANEIGLANEYKTPARKFIGRSAPLHLVMVDYSKSEYFHNKKNGQIYMMKHTETKTEEPRLSIAAAIDQYSRVAWVKYFINKGESSAFVRDVLLEVFEEKVDWKDTGEITGHARLLQGIPRELYFDRSGGNTSGETAIGLFKLNIKKITGSVEIDTRGRKTNRSNSKARGMIEKFIRDFKESFEARLWGKKLLGDLPPDFSLMELNEWATAYCEEYNSRMHPVLNDVRWNLFKPALSEAVFPPDEAKMYFHGWKPTKVQRRLIMGRNRNHWFIAPERIKDGQTVDVLFSGKDCYIFYEGKMLKLRPQEGSIREVIERESASEIYEGMHLRERFGNEILHGSSGEFKISTLDKSLKDDIREFLEKPRSVEEIKERASYCIMVSRSGNRAKNIIEFKDKFSLRE
jgi:hypothetical protein